MIPSAPPKYRIGDKFKISLDFKHEKSGIVRGVDVWGVIYGIGVRARHGYSPVYDYTVAFYRPHESPAIIGCYSEEQLSAMEISIGTS